MIATQTAPAAPTLRRLDGYRPERRDVVPKHRRWFRLSVAGLGIAGALLAVASMLARDAGFSRTYVRDQLVRQKITFKASDALSAEERKAECLVANAGKLMTTGKQAECYANEFIGRHLTALAKGRTYAELGNAQNALRGQIATARANGDPSVTRLQDELTELTRQRQSLFEGESLRGMLLTSYGFSVLGDKAGQAATTAYGAAALVALLSVAGLIWALAASRPYRSGSARLQPAS
ncbi:MAG: hypothetical protein M3144_08690 [Actinomycetota bacterium]|nr:hypothetical protein [Actinomycetota bacterium]